MYSKVISGAVYGIEGCTIHVEADISDGFPTYSMVGYLASEVKEAKERVTTAIRNSGFKLPAKRVIINLSPADLRKQGTVFDLPIAISILCSLGHISKHDLQHYMIIGELGLDGKLLAVPGVLSLMICAKQQGCHGCIIPAANYDEAALVSDIEIIPAKTLKEVVGILNRSITVSPPEHYPKHSPFADNMSFSEDFDELYGQEFLKRSIETAAAGRHHLMIVGPPGAGKSMAVARIPTIMPPLTPAERLQVARIYSVYGCLDEVKQEDVIQRPFRQPHHTISSRAFAGGGNIPRVGELSLAHTGILFLDELTLFNTAVLETMRQPLESHRITISRTHGQYTFPADFMLIGAMNPCRCGYYPDRLKCQCTPDQIKRYFSRISGPLLDRFDLCTEAPRPESETFITKVKGKSSEQMREAVSAARERQLYRYREEAFDFNSQLSGKQAEAYCTMNNQAKSLLDQVFEEYGLSARAYYKLLKVSRTIADLDDSDMIKAIHISEAVHYRMLDQNYWEVY